MRLLIDARVGWGHGIGRVIANTVPRIAALRPDWQIGVLVSPEAEGAASAAFVGQPNINLVSCPVPPFSMAEQMQLERYAKNYDLTWFTNYWVPLGWRGRFVATVHDMLHLIPEYFPASRAKRMLSRRTFTKVRRDAAAVMFVSRFTQQVFSQMIGKPGCGVAIPLGGDHLDYGVRVPVTQRSRRLLVVAASKKHKNFALLLEAWRCAKVADHWTLTIVSPDAMFRSSVDLDGLAGSGGRIEIQRGISNEALARLYGDSAILLMPSLYEGFGLPLLEGMLAGALCISSNAGAMVEVAQGAFVPMVNGFDQAGWTQAIEQNCGMVDSGEPDLEPLIRHNVVCAQRFAWDRTTSETVALLEAAAR